MPSWRRHDPAVMIASALRCLMALVVAVSFSIAPASLCVHQGRQAADMAQLATDATFVCGLHASPDNPDRQNPASAPCQHCLLCAHATLATLSQASFDVVQPTRAVLPADYAASDEFLRINPRPENRQARGPPRTV